MYDAPESTFYIQKSQISIFRYEDVIFNVFPHLAAQKRRGASTIEIFLGTNPFEKQNNAINPVDQANQSHAASSDRDNSKVIREGSREQPLDQSGTAPGGYAN